MRAVVASLFVVCFPCLSGAADLTLAWDPPSDGVTTGYVLFYGTAPQSYSRWVDVGFATSYTLRNLSDGATYYVIVLAHDATGAMSRPSGEARATTALPIAPPLVTSIALTASVPLPQVVGTPVTWRATATGGVPPYEFQWALYQAGTWTGLPWSPASTWTWTPSTPGTDFRVRVAVRSAGSRSSIGEIAQAVPFAVLGRPLFAAGTLGLSQVVK